MILETVNTNIQGPLNGLTFQRNLTDWGETFNIEFDIMIESRMKFNKCGDIVDFEIAEVHPGAYYCEGGLAFECELYDEPEPDGTKYYVTKSFPIKMLNRMYHVQVKQFRQVHISNKLRRFVKLDNEVLINYELDYPKISKQVNFRVSDIQDFGGHIYNLRVTP